MFSNVPFRPKESPCENCPKSAAAVSPKRNNTARLRPHCFPISRSSRSCAEKPIKALQRLASWCKVRFGDYEILQSFFTPCANVVMRSGRTAVRADPKCFVLLSVCFVSWGGRGRGVLLTRAFALQTLELWIYFRHAQSWFTNRVTRNLVTFSLLASPELQCLLCYRCFHYEPIIDHDFFFF